MRIPLTKGKFAVIDDADAALVLPYSWQAKRHGSDQNPLWYASAKIGSNNSVRMHTLLMSCSPIDHRNNDGLDNRRQNLRHCTMSENQGNARLRSDSTSGFKGVTWKKPRGNRKGKWCARISSLGKRIQIGYFQTKEEAALAYNMAAIMRWGDFAKINNVNTTTTKGK